MVCSLTHLVKMINLVQLVLGKIVGRAKNAAAILGQNSKVFCALAEINYFTAKTVSTELAAAIPEVLRCIDARQ